MPPTQRPLAARPTGPLVPTTDTMPALLPPEETRRLREEAALVERFVECYRRQFDALIRRLTDAPPCGGRDGAAAQSVRLCVEAVSMMLVTHGQMARALRHLGLGAEGGQGTVPARVAA